MLENLNARAYASTLPTPLIKKVNHEECSPRKVQHREKWTREERGAKKLFLKRKNAYVRILGKKSKTQRPLYFYGRLVDLLTSSFIAGFRFVNPIFGTQGFSDMVFGHEFKVVFQYEAPLPRLINIFS